LGQLALSRGLSDVALRYAQQALAQDPKRADPLLLAGSAHANLKDLGKAEEEFQQFIQLRPDSAEGPLRLGSVYLVQRRFDLAEREFEKSLALDPKQMQALSDLVTLYRLQGQNEKAIARIRQQIDHGETAELDNLLGWAYTQVRQFQPAEQALKRASPAQPAGLQYLRAAGYFVRRAECNRQGGCRV
jgi:Flp pilus assembly protein TadD